MSIRTTLCTFLALIGIHLASCERVRHAGPETNANVLEHTVTEIDGDESSMERYKGKVVLIVNTASKCGFTPQYEGLQALHESKSDDGLVILGFPSNDFMGQEPGSNEQIQAFCTTEYGVTFPMFEKVSVKGETAHPLFKDLNEAVGEPGWNFNKYLIDREGDVVARYGSGVAPDDEELVAHIDRLIAES